MIEYLLISVLALNLYEYSKSKWYLFITIVYLLFSITEIYKYFVG